MQIKYPNELTSLTKLENMPETARTAKALLQAYRALGQNDDYENVYAMWTIDTSAKVAAELTEHTNINDSTLAAVLAWPAVEMFMVPKNILKLDWESAGVMDMLQNEGFGGSVGSLSYKLPKTNITAAVIVIANIYRHLKHTHQNAKRAWKHDYTQNACAFINNLVTQWINMSAQTVRTVRGEQFDQVLLYLNDAAANYR